MFIGARRPKKKVLGAAITPEGCHTSQVSMATMAAYRKDA
jgi:hypothetical protein